MSFRQGKRRRMTKFTLNEISAVDYPAQEGAVAVLMKRKGEPGYKPKAKDPAKRGRLEKGCRDLVVLTSPVDGHSHGIWIEAGQRGGSTWFGKGPDDECSHDHPWLMDAEGNLTIGMNDGHQHEVDRGALLEGFLRLSVELRSDDNVIAMARKAEFEFTQDGEIIDLVTKCRYDSDGLIKGNVMPAPKKTASTDELQKRMDELEAKLELSKLYGSFKDAERTHFDGLDEAGKIAFAKADESGRADLIEKAADADPVVYKDSEGVEYRKSAGELVIRLAKRADKADKVAAKAQEKADAASLAKRAKSTLGNLPGDEGTHVAVMKALDSIEDEDVRAEAIKTVQAGNTAMKTAFSKVGHGSNADPDGDAENELEKLAKARQKEKGISYEEAYEAVGEENPELLERAITGA